jgi:HK97 family phage portal protein
MAFWDNWFKEEDPLEKLNPAQPAIARDEGFWHHSEEDIASYTDQYENIEVVNRAVNMIIDDSAEIPIKVLDQIKNMTPVQKGIKKKTLVRILNHEPNPYQDINTFKRLLMTDLIMDGNIFIYFDGVHLYHLPSDKMKIVTDERTYIKQFVYNHDVEYTPDEIIFVRDNSFKTIYRGISRLRPTLRTMQLVSRMRNFQDNFFQKGTVLGLVLKNPNVLGDRVKEKMIRSWAEKYNASNGGARPLILDGGMELETISKVNFKDLDFQEGTENNSKTILIGLGVPPVLLFGGNNANIRPNHRLFYLETVLPMVRKLNFALERFFGYKIVEDVTDIPALQPELSDQANYVTTLVNGGIISPDEGRETLGKEPRGGENEEIRVPQNIAGSAVDPSQGGRPQEEQ